MNSDGRTTRDAEPALLTAGPLHFCHPALKLRDKQSHYEWSLLDTHDGTTDVFKHYRNEKPIESVLRELGAEDIFVAVAGNGVEAWCRKAADAA